MPIFGISTYLELSLLTKTGVRGYPAIERSDGDI